MLQRGFEKVPKKANFRSDEMALETSSCFSSRPGVAVTPKMESDMNAAIAGLLPRASATSVADIDAMLQTAIFSGVGLLLSLSVLILDQYIPGEWL